MAVLWSEFLALWFDRTRRRAVPLLLATLLLLIPSLPARSDCSCELAGEGSSLAHHHEEGEAHEHKHADSPVAVGSFTSAPTSHVHLATLSQGGASQSGTSCCSCPRAPVGASAVSAVGAPSQLNADNQSLVYVSVNTLSVYRVDSLTGLFGRAGPPSDSKPQLLSLSSLPGRAPPVSI